MEGRISCEMRDCGQTMKYKARGGAAKQKMKKNVFTLHAFKAVLFFAFGGVDADCCGRTRPETRGRDHLEGC